MMKPRARWNALLLTLSITPAFGATGKEVRIGAKPTVAAFEGWGTSLCWFANAVGRWSEPNRKKVADLLFSRDGLGLNIVRYNIGGGEPEGHEHMIWFRQMESFEPELGKWNWEADAGQRWMLQAAIARGANRTEAFSNSPPHWMTESGCASGGADPNRDNLAPQFQQAFVDYLVTVVEQFEKRWGVRFQTLDPFNEPYTDYWKAMGKQEGCHFERGTQQTLIQLTRKRLDERGFKTVQLAVSDETNVERTIGTIESLDAQTLRCIERINTHTYAAEKRPELRELARRLGKVLVMSEVDGAGAKHHDHEAMEPALELADRILGDLRHLHPASWVFWQAVEDEESQASVGKNWGLLHADLRGKTETLAFTKKYWAMAQFTRFVRPGFTLLETNREEVLAARDSATATIVVVLKNGESVSRDMSVDLREWIPGSAQVVGYRTSSEEDLSRLAPQAVADGVLGAVLPPKSLTTFVVTVSNSPAKVP